MLNSFSSFVYVIFVGAIAGLILYKKLNPQFVRLLVLLLVLTLAIELGAVWFMRTFKIRNHWIYNLFTPVQYFLIWFLFYKAQISSAKRFLFCSLTILVLFFFINILWWQGPFIFNSYTFMLSGALITLHSLSYVFTLYKSDQVQQFTKEPMFWICIGLLIYFPPNIVVTGFIYEIYQFSPELSRKLYQINKILNFLMYSFFLISIIISKLKRNIPNNNSA